MRELAPQDALSDRLLKSVVNGRIGELKKALREAGPQRTAALYPLVTTLPAEAPVTSMPLLGAAAAEGQEGAMEVLLEAGADLDQPALDGRVPLMLAAAQADVGLVKQLLGRGANPLPIDSLGRDAAEHAREMGRARPNDSTWARCVGECIHMIDEAAETWRRARARRRWRIAAWVVTLLRDWQARAAERAYAPGGVGFDAVSDEFHDLAGAQKEVGEAAEEAEAGQATLEVEEEEEEEEEEEADLWALIQQQNAEVRIERSRCVTRSAEEAAKHEQMNSMARRSEAACLGEPTLSHLRLAGGSASEEMSAEESLAGLAATSQAWFPKDGRRRYVVPTARDIT